MSRQAGRASFRTAPTASSEKNTIPVQSQRQPLFNAPRSVTWLCAILVLCHIAMVLLPNEIGDWLFARLALVPSIWSEGHPFYWTLLTYALLHAGFMHVLMNAAMTLAIGSAVARMVGGGTFLAIFALSVIGGGLAIYVFSFEHITVGASGGVTGLIGAAAVLLYRFRDTDPRASTMASMVGIVVILNLAMAFTGGSGISWPGHLGGLAAGLIYGYAANPANGRGLRS